MANLDGETCWHWIPVFAQMDIDLLIHAEKCSYDLETHCEASPRAVEASRTGVTWKSSITSRRGRCRKDQGSSCVTRGRKKE